MKIFKSRSLNLFYFFYRLINPIFDPIKFVNGLFGYIWFIRDLIIFKLKSKNAKLINFNLFPILHEKVLFTPFDTHYFYQELWAFEHILKKKPKEHVDVASLYQLCGYLSKIVKTTFVDLRPIKVRLKNLSIKQGNIIRLPFNDNSITSLTCLHVAEHIGLGRYGDKIDPDGTKKACKELSRVLAPNGFLYFSVPIGKERICFNAHRIHNPQTIINFFNYLQLISFSVVDDGGNFYENVNYEKYSKLNYGCGMFLFTKKGG